MKYYLVDITTGDPKIADKKIYDYKTLNEAEGNFHRKLGTAKLSDLYDSDLVMVITSDGSVYCSKMYKKSGVELLEKYYVIEIAEGDAKIAGKGIYEYDTIDEAEGNFHRKLGTAKLSDLYDSDLVMAISSSGHVYCSEVHKKEVAIDEK